MGKIKSFIESDRGKDILTVLIVILVGMASFGLGRLSKSTKNPGIKVEYQNQSANINSSTSNQVSKSTFNTQNTISVGKAFFASNRGSKYYSLGCSGGKTIKLENRIYFASALEAEQAGYELSSSCK